MQRRMPLLNALRAFQLAARLGSFKAAALEASATYGAISRHVRLLEDWIGAPLFLRHLFAMPLLTWTVRSQSEQITARRWADQMIFETFDPDG